MYKLRTKAYIKQYKRHIIDKMKYIINKVKLIKYYLT